jgi:ferric-dicitrate binding protein FerR (iron transport regulator)
MTWLENPQNEAERLLREGLDQAARRSGDEITHRRVWAKVADVVLEPEPRVSGRLVLVSASLAIAVLAVAGVIAYPYLGSRRQVAVTSTPATAPAPAPAVVPAAPVAKAPDLFAQEEAERAPGNVIRTHKGEHARVALGGGAVADLEENSAVTWDTQHRPAIQRGTASLSVPRQPTGWRFSVTAGPYVVTVVGTKFTVDVGSRSVGVEVKEGVVEVWRGSHSTRLVAGDSWHGPLHPEESSSTTQQSPAGGSSRTAEKPAPSERPQSSVALASPPSPLVSNKPLPLTSRGLKEAESALQSGDVNRAMEILGRAAGGSGPAAENAAYEMARITRYTLKRPRQAVALWDKYRARFPSGLLRTEADLSIVDTLSQIGDAQAALAEAKAFLSRHPNSERRQEVQQLIARLRAAEAGTEAGGEPRYDDR